MVNGETKMKNLILILITILMLSFGGSGGIAHAGDIKLPINTCPKESLFFMDSRGDLWHLDGGQISKYYNSKSVEELQRRAEEWDGAQCPPVIGHASKNGIAVDIPKGYFDNPRNYLTHEQMRKQFPKI